MGAYLGRTFSFPAVILVSVLLYRIKKFTSVAFTSRSKVKKKKRSLCVTSTPTSSLFYRIITSIHEEDRVFFPCFLRCAITSTYFFFSFFVVFILLCFLFFLFLPPGIEMPRAESGVYTLLRPDWRFNTFSQCDTTQVYSLLFLSLSLSCVAHALSLYFPLP